METEQQQSSSEVKEQDLAQQDVTETETASPASESEQQTVPLGKHVALRHRAQEAELQAANLQGQLTVMQNQQATEAPAPKSPLDLEVERQAAEGIAEEDMVISPAIIRADKVYDRQVANQAAKAEASKQLVDKQRISANKAKVEHEDFQEVLLAGDALLTPGELLDVSNAGADFGEKAYKTCKIAIERNKPVSKTDTASETKPSESEAGKKVPTQQEILNDLNVDPVTAAAAQL